MNKKTKFELALLILLMPLLLAGCSLNALPGAGAVQKILQRAEDFAVRLEEKVRGTEKSESPGQANNRGTYDTALEGYWIAVRREEGEFPQDFSCPDYFLEFRGEQLTIRDYSRKIVLQTAFSVTDGGESTGYAWLIDTDDGELSYDGMSLYGTAGDFVMRDDVLYFMETFSYAPDELIEIVGIRTDEGPFDYLEILDDIYLEELQGDWMDPDDPSTMITIEGNTLSDVFLREGEEPHVFDKWEFHVVCTKTNPDYIYLISDDLLDTYFGGYGEFSYSDGKLHTYQMIYDADWDTSMDFEKVTAGD